MWHSISFGCQRQEDHSSIPSSVAHLLGGYQRRTAPLSGPDRRLGKDEWGSPAQRMGRSINPVSRDVLIPSGGHMPERERIALGADRHHLMLVLPASRTS